MPLRIAPVLAAIVNVMLADPLPLTVLAVIQLCERATTHEHPDASAIVMLNVPPTDTTELVLLIVAVSHFSRARHMFAVAVPPARSDQK